MPRVCSRVLCRWRRKLAKLEGEQDETLDFYEALKRVDDDIETASCVDVAKYDE